MSAIIKTPASTDSSSNPPQNPPAPTPPAATVDDLLSKNWSYDTLKGFGLSTLATLGKDLFARESGLRESAKAASDSIKTGFKPLGKLIAAAQELFDTELAAGRLPAGTTFSAYCETNVGKTLDKMGRGAQCARVFQKLVRSGKLPESDYDNATTDWICESVSKILDLAQEKYGTEKYLDSDEVSAVVGILKVRPEKAAAQLRAVKNKLAGKTEVTAIGELTATKAQELILAIINSKFNGCTGLEILLTVVDEAVAKDRNVGTGPAVVKCLEIAGSIVGENPGFPEDRAIITAAYDFTDWLDAKTVSAVWAERKAAAEKRTAAAAHAPAPAAATAPAKPADLVPA